MPLTPEQEAAAKARKRWLIAAGVAAVALIALVVALVLDDDGDEVTTTNTTTTSAAETTTSSEPDTTTTAPATTTTAAESTTSAPPGPLSPADAAGVIWPASGGSTRFADPQAAARSFATDLVGFTDPIIGEFRQGDSRSGEVEVRPLADGPATTVLVRMFGTDDSWWVIGAVTDDIQLDSPSAREGVRSPVTVAGRARAFEGMVQVAMFADGKTQPIGRGFVTGSGGGDLGAFSSDIEWSSPGATLGAIVLYTQSGEDGSVWQATAVPIGLVSG